MIEIDGTKYYTLKELEEKKIASKSTVYRRKREGKIIVYHSLNGQPLIKVEDITKFMKKHSAA